MLRYLYQIKIKLLCNFPLYDNKEENPFDQKTFSFMNCILILSINHNRLSYFFHIKNINMKIHFRLF